MAATPDHPPTRAAAHGGETADFTADSATPSADGTFTAELMALAGGSSADDTTSSPADAAAPGGLPDVPDGFVLERELGRGGMGVVYLARQQGLNRSVALKMVLGTASPSAVIRFLAEAEAVAAVRHPNVVEVYQFGEANGQPFLVLEFCDGGDLTARTKAGRTPPREAAEIMSAVADGVNAAHAKGIVHRDLKPHNVLLADGVPKVTDFGLAKVGGGSDLTQSGAIMGTPAYMSPEQAGGGTKFVGPESDVWALGVMLYELLAGAKPFVGPSNLEFITQIVGRQFPPIRSACPEVPRDLELIVGKCLRQEPRERYANAGELAADLRNWLEGRAITARPMGSVEAAWKWSRRNPAVAASLTFALLAMVAGTIISLWQAGVARFQERQAEDRAGELATALETARREKDEKETARRAEAGLKEEAERNERGIRVASELIMQAFRENTDPTGLTIRTPGFLAALKKRIDQPGGDRSERLLLLNFVGTMLAQFGRDQEAIPILTESLALRRELYGADHPEAVAEACNLGIVHYKAGALGDALPLLLDGIRRMQAGPAAPNPVIVSTLRKVGRDARLEKRFEFARAVQDALGSMSAAKFGPDHTDTLSAVEGLAWTYLDGGEAHKAVELFEKTLAVRSAKTGRDGPLALNAMGNLAVAYGSACRTTEAIQLGEEAHRRWVARHGAEDGGTIAVGLNLATSYRRAGRFADAVPLQVKAAEAHEKERYVHRRAVSEVDELIDTLVDLGRNAEAEAWLRKILPLVKVKSGADSADYAARQSLLGLCLSRQRKWADAEPVLRDSLAIREKLLAGKDVAAWQVANTRSMLGGALVGLKKLAEAERLLAPAHAELARHAQQIPPVIRRERLAESLDRLVWFAEESNDAAAAAKWRAEYATLPSELAPPPRAK